MSPGVGCGGGEGEGGFAHVKKVLALCIGVCFCASFLFLII